MSKKRPLQPIAYIRFSLSAFAREPLLWTPFLLAGAASCLFAIFFHPRDSVFPAMLFGFLLCWILQPLSFSAAACYAYSLAGGERIERHVQLRSYRQWWKPTLAGLFLTVALSGIGFFAVIIGALLGIVLGMWACGVITLEPTRNQHAFDRAWKLARIGGLLWSLMALSVGLLLGRYLALALEPWLGEAALLVMPPVSMIIAVPLTAAALLDRRAA